MSGKVIMLLGPEEGNKDDEIRKIKSEFFSAHPDAETVNLYATEDIEASLDEEINQAGLFSSSKFVTVKHLEEMKKSAQIGKIISTFIKNGSEDVLLLLLSSDTFSPFKIKEIESRIFFEEFDSNKIRWVKQEFAKYEVSISDDGIDELLFSVDNNKAEMRSAISLVALYYRQKGKKSITSDDVSATLRRQKGENGYTLFARIAEKDLENALLSLSSIALEDSMRLVSALSVVTNEFKAAENALEISRTKKENLDSILKNDVEIIGTSSFASQRGISNYRRRNAISKACQNYTADEIKSIINYLISSDVELKSSPDSKSAFERIIYNTIVNSGRSEELEFYQKLSL